VIKSALVTGAGGAWPRRGIDLAREAARCGARYRCFGGRRNGGDGGVRTDYPLVMDLTAAGAAERAVVESLEALGGLDIVVNNAGWGIGEAFCDDGSKLGSHVGLNLKAWH